MSGSTIAAGVIVFLLGLVGLLQLFGVAIIPFDLAVVSAFLSVTGALVLFGLIAIVGIVLIVSGLASIGEPRRVPIIEQPATIARPGVVVAQPTTIAAASRALTDLELVTLRYISQGRRPRDISSATGVSESIVLDKITMLRKEGYVTGKDSLTEKGYETLRAADQRPLYNSSTTTAAPP